MSNQTGKSAKSIYDFPAIYDLVLRKPMDKIEREVEALCTWLNRQGIAEGRVLELACGTCAHAINFAQRGYTVAGIDQSNAMLDAAQTRASATNVELALFQRDLIDFQLDSDPFDCVIFMSETFPIITTSDDLIRHFRAVRSHLRSGGFYIIDLNAFRHGVGAEYGIWGRKEYSLPNGFVSVWHEDFPGDWVAGTSHLVLHCRIELDGHIHETVDDWRLRVWSPWALELFVSTLDDWQLEGFFSYRTLETDIADEPTYFVALRAR